MTGDLVIDMDRCDTTHDTIDTESTMSTVQSKETDDTEKTVDLKEDSSDTVDVDDLGLPDNDYDEEPFLFPLSQNVHCPRYVKLAESDKPDDDALYVSDTEQNWDKLKKGTKLKRYILLTVALYIFLILILSKHIKISVVALDSKLNFAYLVVTS